MKAEAPAPSVFTALGDTIGRASELVQLEFRLAKTELGEKALLVKAGLTLIVCGAILFAGALLLVLQLLVVALIEAGLSAAAATNVVAGVSAAIGFALIASGRKQLAATALTPDRTLDDLQRDGAIVKEKLS
jgi:uncharacterized membrane protein YqjE